MVKMELILYNKDFDDFEAKILRVIEYVVSKEKTNIFLNVKSRKKFDLGCSRRHTTVN